MKYEIEISRTVQTSVEVEADSPEAAVEIVNKVAYELPPPSEWSVQKYSYEYLVTDAEGDELLHQDFDGNDLD